MSESIKLIIALTLGVILGVLIQFQSIPSVKPRGKICLVIDDFGYAHNETTNGFLSLDTSITFAIIPGQIYSSSIGLLADSLGYETIIHMPMEPHNYDSLSEKGFILTEKLNAQEVDERIELSFLEIPTALGLNNHQGSKATANLQLMKYVARSLKKYDKFFLDSFTNPESRAYITMRRFGVKTELRQVFLDHIEDSLHIKAKLDSLVNLSHTMDVAIGIGHVKPKTLSILKQEIPRLKAEGYEFVSLSKIVR